MTSDVEARAEAAYWLARTRLLLKRANAVAEFEREMPSFGGLPRAACWFVDLLWRVGRPERAEQVWKAVRASPRIAACDETPLIEARILLGRGDLDRAEGTLLATTPRDVSTQTDRLLYLAWVKAARRQFDAAASFLQQADELGFYPAGVLSAWRKLIPPKPHTALPPPGVPLIPWLLHHGAMAWQRDDPAEALAWVERALREDASLTEAPEQAACVQAALPALKLLTRAQALAHLARMEVDQGVQPPGLYFGAVDALDGDSDGRLVLDAAERGDFVQSRKALDSLADRGDVHPTLAHHLALIYFRAAWHFEEHKPHLADPYWRRSWRCWLRWAAAASRDDRSLLLDWLLAIHRRRTQELLARDAIDAARRHWNCVMELLQQAAGDAELTEVLATLLAQFRDRLTTEYCLHTRQAMRYGISADGWSADYEGGLRGLTRLLSLDRENLSLLTSLLETCVEWFLECYNNDDATHLARGVERFTPFALQLARLLDQSAKPELTARAALAEFFKFRGFIAPDPARKAAHYREALRFHPGNANVRALLADLEDQA
jgi:hypothetical protein